jgi:hypothetical protein
MITIRVISKQSGKPLKGVKVGLGFGDSIFGTYMPGIYTDSNGDAHFNVSPKDGVVYVNGNSNYKGYLSGRIIVYK